MGQERAGTASLQRKPKSIVLSCELPFAGGVREAKEARPERQETCFIGCAVEIETGLAVGELAGRVFFLGGLHTHDSAQTRMQDGQGRGTEVRPGAPQRLDDACGRLSECERQQSHYYTVTGEAWQVVTRSSSWTGVVNINST